MPTNDFEAALRAYADGLAQNFGLPVEAQAEDQLKAPVGRLLEAAGETLRREVNWRSEAHAHDLHGRPDLGVTVDRLLTGHVELKAPEVTPRPERFGGANKTQWEKFKSLPNIIYTNGSEWSLYRAGGLAGERVRIADDVTSGGAVGLQPDAAKKLLALFRDFLSWTPIVPGSARELAEVLAPLTRVLRDEVAASVRRGNLTLTTLAEEWRGLLFPEANDEQFADAYAQTVTYALLLARFEGTSDLRTGSAAEALDAQHGLIAQALRILADQQVLAEIGMPVELLQRVIREVDPSRLRPAGSDPWLYFYEDFLAAYDPKLRKDRGVYYTPVEVVQAQVRLVGELLRERFGKELAFADEDVVMLDPAVGTGTYPLTAIDYTADHIRQRFGPGAVGPRLSRLSQQMYAFELLVGPYAVAHLRLSQRLRQADAGLPPGGLQVYLTDTLESHKGEPEFRVALIQQRLSREHERARRVKQDVRVFVCIGNPPYDREQRDLDVEPEQRRKGGWVRYGPEDNSEPAILEDFLKPAREAGAGVHLKNVYNDYVYFWRWALWKVFDSTAGAGIVSFITASSYLRGPGFVGMRRRMRETFDELWIIDLEGDNLGARQTENVFAIRTPVAIAVGVRYGPGRAEEPARVWKTKVTGTQAEKFARLGDVTAFADLQWRECSRDWEAPFYPAGTGAFASWPTVTQLFPWQHSGIETKRSWPVGETQEVLKRRWAALLSLPSGQKGEAFREADRLVTGRYQALHDETVRLPSIESLPDGTSPPPIQRIGFRTLDRQWILADSRVGDRMRPELWRAHSGRQVYLVSFLTEVVGVGPGAMASAEIPDRHYFRGSFGGKHVIPLWRDADAARPNITRDLLDRIGATHTRIVSPEDFFSYVYGILAQPAYVSGSGRSSNCHHRVSRLPRMANSSRASLPTALACSTCIRTESDS